MAIESARSRRPKTINIVEPSDPEYTFDDEREKYSIDLLMMDVHDINVSSDPQYLWGDPHRDSRKSLDKIFLTNDSALVIKPEVKKWFDDNQIIYKYSVYFGVVYFTNEEDKVKFILRWL